MSKSKNVLWMKVQEGWSLEKVQALAAYAYLAVQLMPNKTPANKSAHPARESRAKKSIVK